MQKPETKLQKNKKKPEKDLKFSSYCAISKFNCWPSTLLSYKICVSLKENEIKL